MPANLELGTSLVGNPVAVGGDDNGEDELVVLPEQLRRIGALLSTPEDEPTALSKAVLAVLVGYPLWCLVVTDLTGTGPSTRAKALDGDVSLVITDMCLHGAFLLAGPVALHALQLATQSDGFLRQLGMGQAHVPRSRQENLEWWELTLRRTGTVLVSLIAGFMLLWVLIVKLPLRTVVGVVLFVAFVALWLATLLTWWYSLKVASVLTVTPVAAAAQSARAETKRLRERGEPMDPERWKTLVEDAVLKLGRETLRTLSAGWGSSVLFVGVGLVLFALFWVIVSIDSGFWDAEGPNRDLKNFRVVMATIIAGFGVLPFVLAAEPAGASTMCARLENDINDLYAEDPAFVRAMHILRHLKALNKDQGLGFVVGGQVITKRTLWVLGTGIYGVLVAFAPTFASETGLSGSCGDAQHAACNFGWTFADDSCFKLFGDNVLGVPLGWADAEEACQEMDSQTHLASVTSAEQQRVVAHLAADASAQAVWIGLNDFAEEGSFVWSDDEPLEYDSWSPVDEHFQGQDGGDGVVLWRAYTPPYSWGDYPGSNTAQFPYICAKKATPIVASGGDMLGCAGGHWVMGMPYKQPTSHSTRLAPTIVYGIYKEKIYEELAVMKVALNETITTAAECAAVVHRDYEVANAAMYSNVGREECWAVFEAVGVIYDPMLQTCVFEP